MAVGALVAVAEGFLDGVKVVSLDGEEAVGLLVEEDLVACRVGKLVK